MSVKSQRKAAVKAEKQAATAAFTTGVAVEGTVIEVKENAAQVKFPNGDLRWFTVNDDAERQYFALGNKITCRQSTPPQNREQLFEYIEYMYPKLVTHFLSHWGEGTVEREGKTLVKMAMGAGVSINNAVNVYGTPSGEYFFVRFANEKQPTMHHYAEVKEIEQAFRWISDEVTKSLAKTA